MGLRAKLVVALLVVFGVLGAMTITTMYAQLASSYRKFELETARADMRRLVEALDNAVQQLDDALLEWATWTELYDFMRTPSTRFRRAYLTPDAVAQARFWWIGLYDLQGRMVGNVGRDPVSGQALTLPELEDPSSPLAHALAVPLPLGEVDCGLLRSGGQLYAMCRRAISDSRGKAPGRGVVVQLKGMGAEFMGRVGRMTKLEARLLRHDDAMREVAAAGPAVSQVWIGSGVARAYALDGRYLFLWDLHDVLGRSVGSLTMDWPRVITKRGEDNLREQAGLFVLIVLAGAVLMLGVIEYLVVARVRRLAKTLHDICSRRDWAGRTRDKGRDEIGTLSRRSDELLGVIEAYVRELECHSRTDPLTGLANRRQFDKLLAKLMPQHKRNGQPLSLVAIDVDCFKLFNDGYGHVKGDAALRAVGECLRESAQRAADLPCRIGGEEFQLILPDCDEKNAAEVVERFRAALRARAIPHAYSEAAPLLTASVGITRMHADDTAESLTVRADQAMYRAKAAGRDRVVILPGKA